MESVCCLHSQVAARGLAFRAQNQQPHGGAQVQGTKCCRSGKEPQEQEPHGGKSPCPQCYLLPGAHLQNLIRGRLGKGLGTCTLQSPLLRITDQCVEEWVCSREACTLLVPYYRKTTTNEANRNPSSIALLPSILTYLLYKWTSVTAGSSLQHCSAQWKPASL